MDDGLKEFLPQVQLPEKVVYLIRKICTDKNLPPPDSNAQKKLAEAGEEVALDTLRIVYNSSKVKTLSGFIVHLIKGKSLSPNQSPGQVVPDTPEAKLYQNHSPLKRPRTSASSSPVPVSLSPQITQNGLGGVHVRNSPLIQTHLDKYFNSDVESSDHQFSNVRVASSSTSLELERPNKTCRQLSFTDEPPPAREVSCPRTQCFSYQATVFSRELEYRREFLMYNYIGWNKLEDVVSDEDAGAILERKDLAIDAFESLIWNAYGRKHCCPEDRRQSVDWNSGKTCLYYCHVAQDGRLKFKGPHFTTATTHLQRTLGDDNVLIVKFTDVGLSLIERILKEGIVIGLKRFNFFVFKDEGKEEKKKKGTEKDDTDVSTSVKCYFVRLDALDAFRKNRLQSPQSRLNINDARCHFMHVHMVSSMAKYMARFSLILSKTIRLPIDLSSVVIERIEDVPCRDNYGCVIRDGADERILTDGTGFISEDLAMKCPQNFFTAKYMKEKDFKKICHHIQPVGMPYEGGTVEAWNREPPLLMQCRLFSKGSAVKGTLLVNRKLGTGRIQIRPSMVKVERDLNCSIAPTFDSLEIVAISHKPRRCQLSKNLIALLSYGGVPRNFFMDILTRALEETKTVFSDYHAALKVAIKNGDMDDDATAARMISAGVPLNEPHLQTRLATLARSERKGLAEGRLPISESFYLMGTADPTGVLNRDQVCVILENGQISGKVLVYRNPGLHFGDIHILEAVYVKELEDVVGNAKFGIFFSTKGHRSAAAEMANGDFDGDTYWVSRNPQLLRYFTPTSPWTRIYSTPPAVSKKPYELSAEEIENELFQLFLDKRKPSYNMATAADSWMSFMDRLLVLGENGGHETAELREKILKLVDIYYDALDAPKSGKKVNVPLNLKAEKYPDYMGRGNSYVSTSVLGDIFQKATQFHCENQPTREIWKLPCFNTEIPVACSETWRKRYDDYRYDMSKAMEIRDGNLRKSATNGVINKYKQLLYGAEELSESPRDIKDIYNDALALYHTTYDYALRVGDISKCAFAWRVAGSALCRYHAIHSGRNEDPILMLPSILRDTIC